MPDEDNVIDVEAVEIEEGDNLPAVISDAWNAEALEADSVTRSNGKTYTAKAGRSADGLSLDAAKVAKHDAALAANPERRCVAMTSKGQCRKFAILGSTVCKTHGGATKQVVNKARVRVQNVSNRMMGKLIEFAFDDTKPPDTQLRAIRDALDRAGLRPPAEVVVSPGEPKQPWEEVFEGLSPMTREESRRARGLPVEDDMQPAMGLPENEGLLPPTQPDPANPNQPPNQRARREPLTDPTHDPASAMQYQPDHDTEGHSNSSRYDGRLNADRYEGQSEASEYGQRLARGNRGDRPRRPEFDRQPQPEPPVRHITGDEALAESGRLTRQRIEQERQAQLENRNRRPQRALPPGRSTGRTYGRGDV